MAALAASTGSLAASLSSKKTTTLKQQNVRFPVKAAARRTVTRSLADGNKLWTPSSARPEADFAASVDTNSPVSSAMLGTPTRAGGRAPPSPAVAQAMNEVLGQLFHQRIVRLGGAVDDDMANLIVAQLLYLNSADPKKDISIYVNSPGGSVTAGMAIFDTMRYVSPDCSTTCVGLAASMGAFLLTAGHKGKRFTLPHSRIMIHQPLGGAQGQAADIEIQANEIMHHKATLSAYIAEFSGNTLEKIIEDTDRDFFMSADEALAYGLVDHVIQTPQLAKLREVELYPKYDLSL
eukprot:CAMPEP_0118935122 /NCGR_PEP_ID=MMETSP1169-20130426/14948_1 /TAXON_ID=36882 /ORGANISM="Pyramimonas obovata, Strain CCMP722" /LENGTH=291 /DNA_ID=CAMNT_0006878109 /DNA_START=41 /DNA_END=916 /DNA_ORIENTATION=+